MNALTKEYDGLVWRLWLPGEWRAFVDGLEIRAEQDYSSVSIVVYDDGVDYLGRLVLANPHRPQLSTEDSREQALQSATAMILSLVPQWQALRAGSPAPASAAPPIPPVARAGGPAVVAARGSLFVIAEHQPTCQVRHAFPANAKRDEVCACGKVTLGRLLDRIEPAKAS